MSFVGVIAILKVPPGRNRVELLCEEVGEGGGGGGSEVDKTER